MIHCHWLHPTVGSSGGAQIIKHDQRLCPISCAALPAVNNGYRDTDHKCTILHLFHVPNDFIKLKVENLILSHHSVAIFMNITWVMIDIMYLVLVKHLIRIQKK